MKPRHPSPAACRRLLDSHAVPPHIQQHSRMVAGVARRIATGLRRRGDDLVDVALVEAAALLHDIAKACCLESQRDHAAEGGRLLRELGLEEIARLVERHVVLGPWDPAGRVTEAEIVNYSDKRVRYVEVVSLGVRFQDLIERYGRGRLEIEERIRRNWDLMRAVEAKIFRALPFGPEDLVSPSAGHRARAGSPRRAAPARSRRKG